MSIIEKLGPDKTTLMKTSWLLLFLTASLYGCNADTSTNKESDKETQMFGKQSEQTYVISSPMQGLLKLNGESLANTKITRRLRWNGNEEGLVEEFMTDDRGQFSLPVHEEPISLSILTQFVSSSKLEVEIDGEIFDVWYNNKFEGQIYAETGKELTNLVCDLEEEEIVLQSGLSRIMTVCRWSSMPDPDL